MADDSPSALPEAIEKIQSPGNLQCQTGRSTPLFTKESGKSIAPVHMLRSCPLLRIEEFRYCDRVFDVFPVLLSCFVVIAPFPI